MFSPAEIAAALAAQDPQGFDLALKPTPPTPRKVGTARETSSLTNTVKGPPARDFYAEADALADKAPDYSQQQAHQRSAAERSQGALIMSLLAQGTGPGSDMIGAHYARQARVDPIRVEGGFIDAQGNAVIDPGFQRQRQVESLYRRGDVQGNQQLRREQLDQQRERDEQASADRAAQRALTAAIAANRPRPQEPLHPVDDGNGNVTYMPRSQAAGMRVPQRQNAASAKLQASVDQQNAGMAKIDAALEDVRANPDAFGLAQYAPDAITQRLPGRSMSGGVPARASVANIGSQIIHDRSGAAVTIAEMPRLQPFVPRSTDSPETVIKKLTELRRQIEIEQGALRSNPQFGNTGARVGSGTSADAQDVDALLRKYGN